MPIVCRFYGIVIAIYYDDHGVPHFHARYGDQKASIAIDTLEILEGALSTRARAFVLEWASLHATELRENWQRARRREPLVPIDPLE